MESPADTLRSNSELASNESFLPVMGLIFLRHAYSRFLAVQDEIIANLPKPWWQNPRIYQRGFFAEDIQTLTEYVYCHVYRAHPTVPSPIYV